MNVKGKIHSIGADRKVSEKLSIREFVIVTDEKYPQHLQFQLLNDKCEYMDGRSPGDEINVHYNLRGRLWADTKNNTEKCFVTLDCWKIEGEAKADHYDHPAAHTAPKEDLPF